MATSEQINDLVALYAGYFNRAPDPAGLQFWIDQIDGGREFNTIAADFATSAEATALYPYLTAPDVASPSTFITSIYQNLFNRTPDQAGLDFWTDVLAQGSVSVADMIEEIIIGAVDAPNATPATFDATTLENKIEVGLDFAVDAANTSGFEFDAEAKSAAIAAIDGVTNDEATVDAAKAATDAYLAGEANEGDTLTLTTGADALVGTADNDTFNALSVNATGAAATTFSSFDSIDGGAGKDTLNIFAQDAGDLNEGFPATASVKNVETVNINNIDDDGFGDVNASNFQGATQIWQAAFASDISMVEASTTAGFRNLTAATADDLTVTAADAATAASVALESVKGDKATNVAEVNVKGAALASANVSGTLAQTTTGAAAAAASLALDVALGKDVQAATVNTGVATSLTIENTGKDLTSVDASASAGAITYTSADSDVATIKTGSGNDNVEIQTVTSSTAGAEVAAVLEAGAGDDMVEVATTGTGTSTVSAGAGNDTVTLSTDAGTGKLSVDLGEGDDAFMVNTTAPANGVVSKSDVIDGGAGSDTLQLTAVGAANISAFSNFEVFDVKDLSGTLDVDILATNNTVTEFVGSDAVAGGGATLASLGAGVGFRATADMGGNDLTLTQKTAGDLTVTLDADSTKDAANDAGIDVVASNATTVNTVFSSDSAFVQTPGAGATENNQSIDLTAGKATAINVTSGGTNATNDLDLTTAQVATSGADALKTVTITGSQALNLEITESVGSASAVTAIDASAMAGALTVSTAELKTSAGSDAFDGGTLTLGSGDDVVTITDEANIASIGKGTKEDATQQEGFDVVTTGGTVAQAGDADTADVIIKDGLLTFKGAGPTTLTDALGTVASEVTVAGEAVVFEYVGNSYIFVDGGAGADTAVKLVGTTGLNGLDEVGTSDSLYVF
ncbi:DUF4214 domain-containing protein [Sulfitobacter sp. W074]|uniref:DUF4214 domain-containing protein n=1 Tax=Sulfitobacter sp. W074 TaxID=2867026 RepID=UPI0021A39AC3|nr:DUF4214 domain-containing protein [Sulfitobacter sp. W074]UWR39434.1 DUF4214 domain-containing protein [Sulfitobacter sp. W074]